MVDVLLDDGGVFTVSVQSDNVEVHGSVEAHVHVDVDGEDQHGTPELVLVPDHHCGRLVGLLDEDLVDVLVGGGGVIQHSRSSP